MKIKINDDMMKYREKHKDCRFCTYTVTRSGYDCFYYVCLLKRKRYDLDFTRLHGLFCKHYTIEDKRGEFIEL